MWIATIASAISGIAGYLLGHFLWDLIGNWVVPHLISLKSFSTLSNHLEQYEHWAVFIAALIHFHLKALSVVAGVFHHSLSLFMTYLVLARLLRFSIIGSCMAMWGEKIKTFMDRHFHRIFLLVGAKVGVAAFIFWIFAILFFAPPCLCRTIFHLLIRQLPSCHNTLVPAYDKSFRLLRMKYCL